jgi:hypothetical protein
MEADACEQIAMVREGLDVLALAACNQGAKHGSGSPALVAPIEKPVVATCHDGCCERGLKCRFSTRKLSMKGAKLSCNNRDAHGGKKTYALLTARIGIVTPADTSDAPNMWERPSKIPPGSITMHGECTSPVTTPFD